MIRKPFLSSVSLLLILVFCQVCGCTKEKNSFHVGVLQWSEQVKPFALTYQGILDSLSNKGYHEDLNLIVSYKNVEQDKNLARQAAQDFVKNGVDLIVALGTGSSIAAKEATKEKRIPIVYSIVAAPEATGILADLNSSRQNITGISMRIPVVEQFRTVRELLPQMKRIGIFYCTEMIQAVATGEEAAVAADDFGWQPVISTVTRDELSVLSDKLNDLAGQVDAIYIPTDPILSTPENLASIVKIADRHGVPVFGVAEEFVSLGFLAAVHCDYYEIGRQTGEPIAQILRGIDLREIKPQDPSVKRITINLGKARILGLSIDRKVIQKADNIIN